MKNHVFKNETMFKNAAKWGPDLSEACPKIGVSYFRKKWFGVFGGCNGARHVPKSGFLISGKNGLAFSGGATARRAKCGMSQNRGFLFPEKTWLDSTTFFKLSVFDMWPPFYINGVRVFSLLCGGYDDVVCAWFRRHRAWRALVQP
jgi:hypothetical protein